MKLLFVATINDPSTSSASSTRKGFSLFRNSNFTPDDNCFFAQEDDSYVEDSEEEKERRFKDITLTDEDDVIIPDQTKAYWDSINNNPGSMNILGGIGMEIDETNDISEEHINKITDYEDMEIVYEPPEANPNDNLDFLSNKCAELSAKIQSLSKIIREKIAENQELKAKLSTKRARSKKLQYLNNRNNIMKKEYMVLKRRSTKEVVYNDKHLTRDAKVFIGLLLHKP